MQCPRCKRPAPATVNICRCGYNRFKAGEVRQSIGQIFQRLANEHGRLRGCRCSGAAALMNRHGKEAPEHKHAILNLLGTRDKTRDEWSDIFDKAMEEWLRAT